MSKFYGMAGEDDSKHTNATRRGFSNIRASAQTYEGSLIAIAEEDKDGEIRFRIQVAKDDSSSIGHTVFCGSLEELIDKLGAQAVFE